MKTTIVDEPRKTVVILGMPRSFSSMTSGGLHGIGVHMGDRMIGSDWSNPLGHFENKEFVGLNKDILKWSGGTWMDMPTREKILTFPDKERIKDLVKRSQKDLWGWKDPRTAITIDLYLPYLINPIFIVCYRDPNEIAKSLLKRDKTPIEVGHRVAVDYFNRINDFLKRYYAGKSL